MFLVIKWSFFFILILSSIHCIKKSFTNTVEDLIQNEKYQVAMDRIRERLESQRLNDIVLSSAKPLKSRMIELSSDRNRIVWTEDNKVIFKDIANPQIKSKSLDYNLIHLGISQEGDYAVITTLDTFSQKCQLHVISFIIQKENYISKKTLSCQNRGAISRDGQFLFYVSGESLYKENMDSKEKPEMIATKDKILPQFTKIENKYILYSFDDYLLIFVGNAGSYNLYLYIHSEKRVEKLESNLLLPQLYFGQNRNIYFIEGSVGFQKIREYSFPKNDKPSFLSEFSVSTKQLDPWEVFERKILYSSKNGRIYKWSPNQKREQIPLFCEKFWGIARDMIVHENKKGELVLSSLEFSEEENRLLELYLKTKRRLKDLKR